MTNVLTGLSCDTLYNMYTAYVERLQDLVKGTRDLLRKIKDIAAFPFKRIEALVNEYLSMLNGMQKILDFSNVAKVIAALKKMLECPILADMFGAQIAGILDNIGKGAGKLKKLVSGLLQNIANMVTSSLAPIKAALMSPLNSATSMYEAFVKGQLGPIFKMLKTIQDCLGNMCAAYKAVKAFEPGTIIKPLEKYGVKFEGGKLTFAEGDLATALRNKWNDMKGKVTGDIANSQKMLAAKVDRGLEAARKLKDSAMILPTEEATG